MKQILLPLVASLFWGQSLHAQGLANGVKIGEVTHESAVLWTRTTAATEASNRTPAWEASDPHWTVPGVAAQVRFQLFGEPPSELTLASPWVTTSADDDFCHQHRFEGLPPATSFRVMVEAREKPGAEAYSMDAAVTTAPAAEVSTPLTFTVSTCQDFPRRDDQANGHRIYSSMLKVQPAFFVQTGDTLYYDRPRPFAKDIATARYKWNRMYALPYLRAFHRQVPSYWMHDDHDMLKDDCYPGQTSGDLTWAQGIKIWKEQIPQSDKPYRTFRWGKDLQIWLPEVRYFRSPNTMKDGPEKTILGGEQWAWLEQTLKDSDATFKLYISPTPVVGPDRKTKNDNHSNATYAHEGRRLRELLSSTRGAFVINGDRHWQYHSIDATTGLNEFGCGPASDAHAGGWKPGNRLPEHQFLRVAGGFMSVQISATKMTLQTHDVSGQVVYEHLIEAAADGE
ncbi:MAG: alkaline phosphatase D [Planctomycetota bacterium]|jgi:alkaline phosphatase D